MKPIKILGVFGMAFLLLPLVVVLLFSVNPAPYISFPPTGFSLKWFSALFANDAIIRAVKTSIVVALGVATLSTVLGTPAAIWLWRSNSRFKGAINALLMAPLLTPLIVLAISIYALYASLHLIGSTIGLIVAQTTLGLPMVVTAVSACLANVNGDLERAASVLGAKRGQTLFRVTLPMASSGMVTGFVLAFGISFDELLIAMFVAGITGQTLPVKIWEQLRTAVSPEITAAAAVLICVSITLLALVAVVQSMARQRQQKEEAK